MAKHPDVEAMNEVYKVAREHADVEISKLKDQIEGIKKEYLTRGIIKLVNYNRAHDELIRYAALYQLKEDKAYRAAGLNWEDFCESIGEDRRNVDRIFTDLRPLYDEFQDKLSGLLGIGFSKIRYLGRSVADNLSGFENGCLVFDGEKIPITPENREEIEAAIEKIKDDHKKALNEAELTIKAKDRIITGYAKTINDQEKTISKQESRLKEKGLLPGEEEFYQELEHTKGVFNILIEKLHSPQDALDNASPRMRASFIDCLTYITRIAEDLLDDATNIYGAPNVDIHKWTPPESPGASTTGAASDPGNESQSTDAKIISLAKKHQG